jgi:hypothetical protein
VPNPSSPKDLAFQETRDRENFQGRYILRHPYTGDMQCPEARSYREELRQRRQREAETLAQLTGWPVDGIRRKQGSDPVEPGSGESGGQGSWWEGIWKK